ncbi:hypothetical protein M422DRAFT_258977 [Sphaerobolus stellatus SS14]|uniref:DUF6533 domain-containing protein n=1 Tax=Sphaerobolus stellatus (strain SS14) TaxID=990650 RepID=A0A0C9VL98_SPHS4|nr:hypothetical protein M422DRAFT_258977 [Sphaerobolus stellatus SS14]
MLEVSHGPPPAQASPPMPASATTSPTPEILASNILYLHATLYLTLAPIIAMIYDHSLTFDQEVRRIWRRPLSGASLLFLMVRYLSLSFGVLGLVWFLSPITNTVRKPFNILTIELFPDT